MHGHPMAFSGGAASGLRPEGNDPRNDDIRTRGEEIHESPFPIDVAHY